LNDLREELTRAADEGLALNILVGAWRFAHEHELRLRIADAEYDLAKLPASTPHAMAYSAIDAGGAAWLVEAWIIVEPIEGGTPNGRGTY